MRPGVPANESTQLQGARRGINAFESETAIVRRASTFLGEDKPRPIGATGHRPISGRRGPGTPLPELSWHQPTELPQTRLARFG